MTDLGQILEERGMSSYALAKKIKIHENMVRKYVRGLSTPSLEIAVLISRALHLPISKIFRDIIKAYEQERKAQARKKVRRVIHRRRVQTTRPQGVADPYFPSI